MTWRCMFEIEAVCAPIAVEVDRVTHDRILSPVDTVHEAVVRPVINPRGGAVDRGCNVWLSTEPDVASILRPVQTGTRIDFQVFVLEWLKLVECGLAFGNLCVSLPAGQLYCA